MNISTLDALYEAAKPLDRIGDPALRWLIESHNSWPHIKAVLEAARALRVKCLQARPNWGFEAELEELSAALAALEGETK